MIGLTDFEENSTKKKKEIKKRKNKEEIKAIPVIFFPANFFNL